MLFNKCTLWCNKLLSGEKQLTDLLVFLNIYRRCNSNEISINKPHSKQSTTCRIGACE